MKKIKQEMIVMLKLIWNQKMKVIYP